MIRRVKSLVIIFLAILLLLLLYSLLTGNSEQPTSSGPKVKRLNTSTLQLLQSYRQVLITNNTLLALKEGICQDVLTDAYYKDLIELYLKSWYNFIPDSVMLDVSNCWCSKSIFPALPKHIYTRMRLLKQFRDVLTDFEQPEIRMILQTMRNLTLPVSDTITDRYFCLPTIFLMGMSKCGTTLLYSYIIAHPQVAQPQNKEGQFWRDFVATMEPQIMDFQVLLYIYHFYGASTKIKEDPETLTIDASASTIFATANPLREVEKDVCIVPLLMYSTLPNAKFIVIMRDPVERLWSDFWYFCSREHWRQHNMYNIPESVLAVASEMFHNFTVTAIQEFIHCLGSGHSQFHCTTLAGSYPGRQGSCERVRLGLSIYYIHLVKWYNVFPRKLILPIKFENLISNPLEIMDEVWPFLELDYADIKPIKKKMNANEWIASTEYSKYFKMWPETRALLKKFFEPYNLALADLLLDKDYLWP